MEMAVAPPITATTITKVMAATKPGVVQRHVAVVLMARQKSGGHRAKAARRRLEKHVQLHPPPSIPTIIAITVASSAHPTHQRRRWSLRIARKNPHPPLTRKGKDLKPSHLWQRQEWQEEAHV